jgi:hypothetical protein
VNVQYILTQCLVSFVTSKEEVLGYYGQAVSAPFVVLPIFVVFVRARLFHCKPFPVQHPSSIHRIVDTS